MSNENTQVKRPTLNRDKVIEDYEGLYHVYSEGVYMFIDDYKTILSDISNSINSRDIVRVEVEANSMKEALESLCAEHAEDCADELFELAKNRQFDRLPESYKRLNVSIEQLLLELEVFADEINPESNF